MTEHVRGYVYSYGGGRANIQVHPDTQSYPDGDVVIIPAVEYDALFPPTVYPERWWPIYVNGVDLASTDERAARTRVLANSRLLGILHLRSDGTTEMIDP